MPSLCIARDSPGIAGSPAGPHPRPSAARHCCLHSGGFSPLSVGGACARARARLRPCWLAGRTGAGNVLLFMCTASRFGSPACSFAASTLQPRVC